MILRKTEPKKEGFTVLELMVVVAIIAIVTSIGLSTYVSQLDDIRVRGDIRALEQQMMRAKMYAITENIPHGIVFNRDDNSYFIFRDNAPAPNGDGMFTNPDGNVANNTDPDSPTEDFVLNIRLGAGGGANYLPDRIYTRISGGNFQKINQFTCILGSTNTTGTEYILFDPMGAVTPAVANNLSVIAVQRVPDASGGQKPRGWIYVQQNTGLTETVLSQTAPTTNGSWCLMNLQP